MSTNLVNLAQQAAGQPSSDGNLLQLAQQAKEQSSSSALSQAWDEAKSIPKAAGYLAKRVFDPRVPVVGKTHYDKQTGKVFVDPNSLLGTVTAGLPEEQQAAEEKWREPGVLSKVQAAGHELASFLPLIGPFAAGRGEQFTTDPKGAAARSAVDLLAGTAMEQGPGAVGKISKAIDSSKSLGKEAIASKAAPHIEAAGDEVRGAVKQSLAKAESRVEPLYKNLHEADAKEIASRPRTSAPGSIDVSAARNSLNEARKDIYGDVNPKSIEKESTKLSSYGEGKDFSFADMRTARTLRSEINEEINSAIRKGDRKSASTLRAARNELTKQMKTRAAQLGLSKDFDKADAQWHEIQNIRERLSPLTDQENSAKLFDSYQNASPEVRNAMTKLSKEGLLDKGRMDKLNQLVQKVNKAMHPRYSNYIARMALGYLPARLGLDYLQRLGIVPKSSTGFMLPYALGSGGYVLADLLKGRISALKAIKDLPELGESTSLQEVKPSRPKFPKYEANPAASSAPDVARESNFPRDPEKIKQEKERYELESKIPPSMRPSLGEQPLLEALLALRQETQMSPEQERMATQLEEELRKHGEKVRAKHRTAASAQEYKRRYSNPIP